MTSSIIWLIIFLITLIIEGLTVGLVSIWFSIGSIGAFITTYFTDSIIIQLVVFVFVSLISLLVTRPISKKFLVKEKVNTNCNALIGEIGIVKEDISKTKVGTIKVKGQIWSALNSDKGIIKKDSEVEVLSIEGVKLIVRKKDIK